MQKIKEFVKKNLLDLVVATTIVLVSIIVLISHFLRLQPDETSYEVTVRVGSVAIIDQIEQYIVQDEQIYLNGIDSPLKVESFAINYGDVEADKTLDIVLSGTGHENSDGSIVFNGQKILINQKAEVRGSTYYAKGAIVNVVEVE